MTRSNVFGKAHPLQDARRYPHAELFALRKQVRTAMASEDYDLVMSLTHRMNNLRKRSA